MKKSSRPLHQRVLERISEYPESSLLSSLGEGVEILTGWEGTQNPFGVVMEGSAAEYLAARSCTLYHVGNLNERHHALAFPRGLLP